MYIPRSFKEERIEVLHDLIRRYSFGILFNQEEGSPIATHLPFMIDPDKGEYGTLVAHFARANPHWKRVKDSSEVLVVFQGPHCYISPSWYVERSLVPTWNYAAVHVYGPVEINDDPKFLRPMLEKLVEKYESTQPNSWAMKMAESNIDALMQAIVGFEVPVSKIEGKFKFNQNLSKEDQQGVVRALEGSPNPMEREVAAIITRNLAEKGI